MTYPNYELIEYICREKVKELSEQIKYPKFRMYTFPQIWDSTATGFDANGGFSGQAITEEYTTVVEIKWYQKNDTKFVLPEDIIYAVFFGNRIAYMCINPNKTFHEDLNNRCMKSQKESPKYYDKENKEDKT